MKAALAALLLVLALQAGGSSPPALPLEITYIANAGFLLSSNEQKVLIDSLHRGGILSYAAPPPGLRQEMEAATGRFADVSLVLVSHPHADHFDAAAVARHLESNPQARLISSPQVIEAVQRELGRFAESSPLLQATYPEGNQRSRHARDGTSVEIFRLRHEHERNYGVHNLGQIITLGGKKVLHIGDAEMSPRNFAPHDLPADRIDIALVPYWYLTSEQGRTIVREHIRPQHIIAMHIEPEQREEIATEIRAEFPEAILFSRPGDSRQF